MIDIEEGRLNAALELFYYAYRAFTTQPDALLSARGWGRVHHRVLYFIAREPGLSVNTLLARLGVSKQALHAPLRELQAAALIEARAAEHDRRVKCLYLSDDGVVLERELSGSQRAIMAQVFSGLEDGASDGWRAVMCSLAAADTGVVRRDI
ncbi:MarR family winged helix-turn-helix transcriptional regulator [Chitinolyticbacter meiyuanensis]|uniref:MarR family winged helix-turn-helix transcriptional regulator n=1 Tax=Chitinolyticbacter meiyuanensis TaxID=682798 RepID=UPI001FE9E220|nr:MarR family winged helix-turn-helix transcriptional regulator [Chitinolyticbacter meiyuanensis]